MANISKETFNRHWDKGELLSTFMPRIPTSSYLKFTSEDSQVFTVKKVRHNFEGCTDNISRISHTTFISDYVDILMRCI